MVTEGRGEGSWSAERDSPSAIQRFLSWEAAGGVTLVAAAVIALVWANSPLADVYGAVLKTPAAVRVGSFEIAKPVLLWINDGLMAIFFLLVGLEIKREFLEGELSGRGAIALPGIAAASAMAVPAAIYLAFNRGGPAASGWAIPTATDIAFAVGVLALLGTRAPNSLKVFLLALAIIDDLGAIIIIAMFYTTDLSTRSLVLAGAALALLVALNRSGCARVGAYVLAGVFLWVCVLKSGVHATLAGVALGFAVPLRGATGGQDGPLRRLEHSLHPWVAFGILPVFALANAGVSLTGVALASLMLPIPLGIALGLFGGKQLGASVATWLCIRAGLGALPEGASWLQMYGVCVLTGVGFTMSLFIGTLAFAEEGQVAAVRLGVLAGSLLSAVLGYIVLYAAGARSFST
ncbi:MAG TPA: Na+/H+ antiporter NhaA [Methylomirabilota bacterium]|jgi:NhaA family Na+:H+ antiporter